MTAAPLGRLLVDTGVLTSEALEEVLEAQRGTRLRLGDLLVERGLVRAEQLAQVLSHQLSVPWVRLAHTTIEEDVLALVPREVAIAHHVLPVHVRRDERGPRLYVAADDPTDTTALAACSRAARMPVRAMVALAGDLRDAVTRAYGEPPSPVRARVSAAPGEAEGELGEEDIVEALELPAPRRRPTVLALNAPERFFTACREAVAAHGAKVVDGSLVRAAELAAEHRPCAIVVTEDVYAFDREGLERLALDHDAALVAWNEDAEATHLAPLLVSAVLRAARAGYEVGVIVDGRYELLRELDAPVPRARWEVRHRRTARRGLLEIGLGELGGGVRAKQVALARVTHPAAPELRDAAATESGDPYVVLELLEGRSLDALLATRGAVPAADACAIGVQLADLLAAAHVAGVSHGDVRLANVLLVRDAWSTERVKLVGWERATRSVAPSEATPKEVARLDVAAVAACVAELAAGRDAEAPAPLAALSEEARGGSLDARALGRALAAAVPGVGSRSALLEPLGDGTATPSRRPGPEQRRFPRAPYRTPVRLEVPGFGSVDGRTEDVSIGGILVVARAEVEPGTKVNVRFALPVDGKVVTEHAIVRWVRAAHKDDAALHAIGVELSGVSPETRTQIERYVGYVGEDAK